MSSGMKSHGSCRNSNRRITLKEDTVMSKKKKKALPTERNSRYAAVVLGILIIAFILAVWNSTGRYSGETIGKVSEVFYVMPNQSGHWRRLCEISFNVNGKEYKIRTSCTGLTATGDSCKVYYNPRRPENAFADW